MCSQVKISQHRVLCSLDSHIHALSYGVQGVYGMQGVQGVQSVQGVQGVQ